MKQENEKLEFKREVNDGLIKEIIAFCNTKGGTIVIGYEDDGTICGVTDTRKELDRISNMIHDSIEPDISFLISQRIEKEESKEIIIIEVLQGTSKPYYLKSKGMTPSGVYIRLGVTSQPATKELIREMLMETSGVSFEKNLSNNQELTFNYTERIFKDTGIAFGKRELKILGIVNEKDMFTNLGLLLSDQCPYTIKMAVYTNDTKVEFIDKKETAIGSILQQLEESDNYLKLNNKVAGKIVGLNRIDKYDYQNEVLRECLLNCIGHRDYEIPGSSLVHIFKNSIEFLSLGGLVKGLTIEDIKLGSSSSRNPKLVSIFHRLGLVEAYGSGIPRIIELYNKEISQPEIKVAPNSFLLKIPKLISKKEYDLVIEYLTENKQGNREDIEKVLNTKKTTTGVILKEMVDRGIIQKEGGSKNTLYKLK